MPEGFNTLVLSPAVQDTSYAFPLDRKAQLPDDILRTKTLVLRPTTLEAAREEMDQVCRAALASFSPHCSKLLIRWPQLAWGLNLQHCNMYVIVAQRSHSQLIQPL